MMNMMFGGAPQEGMFGGGPPRPFARMGGQPGMFGGAQGQMGQPPPMMGPPPNLPPPQMGDGLMPRMGNGGGPMAPISPLNMGMPPMQPQGWPTPPPPAEMVMQPGGGYQTPQPLPQGQQMPMQQGQLPQMPERPPWGGMLRPMGRF